MFTPQLFRDRLSDLCKANKTTITRFAKDVLKTSTSSPTNWKNGVVPGCDILYEAATYFGVTSDYLLGLDNCSKDNLNDLLTHEEAELISTLRAADPTVRDAAFASLRGLLETFEVRKDKVKSSSSLFENELSNKGAV